MLDDVLASHQLLDFVLRTAVESLLSSVSEEPKPECLWHMQYSQQMHYMSGVHSDSGVITLPDISPKLSLDDHVLNDVRSAWEQIVGDDKGDGFMKFEEREKYGVEEDE